MTSHNTEQQAIHGFTTTFGETPAVLARAPGRVELLGNHTDYNGGLVLAVAIDRYTSVAGRAVDGREGRVRSAGFGEGDAFLVDNPDRGDPGSWSRYVRGVVWALGERFEVR